jgi:formylglycine-generating enzyme required for sulfatase activity
VRRLLALAAAVAAAGALLVTTGAASLARREIRRAERARHAARGETGLRVVNPATAAVALYRAGAALDDATPLPLPEGQAWLPEGRYFVEATLAQQRLLFPVTPDGSGEGPDEDGAWTVTVRQTAAESPPVLDASGPGFVLVPGGWFRMGEEQNPGQPHPVWVPTFHAAAFEVTNRDFRRFLADPQGFEGRSSWTEAGWRWKASGLSQPTARLAPQDPRYARFGRDELPVMLVTWYEANAYCRWLTRRLGTGRWQFRLPTEAEWEKAARGPDGFDYGLGMELSEPQAPLYNWRKNPGADVTLVGPREAGYRPNRYGVLHASGNAREWTQSVFRRLSADNPWRNDDRDDDDASGLRVTRGGSWYSASSVRLRLAYREEFQPELSSDDLGFRIVAVLGAGPPD